MSVKDTAAHRYVLTAKTCVECGRAFEARGATAAVCSDRCTYNRKMRLRRVRAEFAAPKVQG